MPEAKTLGRREIEKAVDAIDLPRVLEAVKSRLPEPSRLIWTLLRRRRAAR